LRLLISEHRTRKPPFFVVIIPPDVAHGPSLFFPMLVRVRRGRESDAAFFFSSFFSSLIIEEMRRGRHSLLFSFPPSKQPQLPSFFPNLVGGGGGGGGGFFSSTSSSLESFLLPIFRRHASLPPVTGDNCSVPPFSFRPIGRSGQRSLDRRFVPFHHIAGESAVFSPLIPSVYFRSPTVSERSQRLPPFLLNGRESRRGPRRRLRQASTFPMVYKGRASLQPQARAQKFAFLEARALARADLHRRISRAFFFLFRLRAL